MSWVGWLAAAFGLLTLVVVALMMPPKTVQDPTMKYEAMVAVGFGMLLFAGPSWLLQLGFTIAAAVSGGGDALLWIWLFCAPPAGGLPPIRALLHLLARRRPAGGGAGG